MKFVLKATYQIPYGIERKTQFKVWFSVKRKLDGQRGLFVVYIPVLPADRFLNCKNIQRYYIILKISSKIIIYVMRRDTLISFYNFLKHCVPLLSFLFSFHVSHINSDDTPKCCFVFCQ